MSHFWQIKLTESCGSAMISGEQARKRDRETERDRER